MKWINHLQWEKVKVFVMASMMVELADPPATLKEHLKVHERVLHLESKMAFGKASWKAQLMKSLTVLEWPKQKVSPMDALKV